MGKGRNLKEEPGSEQLSTRSAPLGAVDTSFGWSVAVDGYQPVNDPTGSSWLLEPPGSFSRRVYSPLVDETGLFHILANTPMTQDAIVTFTDTYGLLRAPRSVEVAGGVRSGERVEDLRKEIVDLHHAVRLWDLITEDQPDLQQYILWGEHEVLYRPNKRKPKELVVIASHTHYPDVLHQLRPSDLSGAVLFLIQSMINQRIRTDAISQLLLWHPRKSRPINSDEIIAQPLRLHLTSVPTSLIGAIWLQFSEAVTEQKNYSQCALCGKWFELTPKMASKGKEYCSNSCRSKHYRHRQHEALRLIEGGVPIDQIAKRLRTDVATVMYWIDSKSSE